VAERSGQEIRYELNTTVFQDLAQSLMDWTKPAVVRPRRALRIVTKEQGA
jgi:hypothetical protein